MVAILIDLFATGMIDGLSGWHGLAVRPVEKGEGCGSGSAGAAALKTRLCSQVDNQ